MVKSNYGISSDSKKPSPKDLLVKLNVLTYLAILKLTKEKFLQLDSAME